MKTLRRAAIGARFGNTNAVAFLLAAGVPPPDGTWRAAGSLVVDIQGGAVTLRPSHWCDSEDGRTGTAPGGRMALAAMRGRSWWAVDGLDRARSAAGAGDPYAALIVALYEGKPGAVPPSAAVDYPELFWPLE